MLDRLSVPRRALDFEDYIDIVRRNFRWLIGPAFAGLIVSTVVAYMMQDTYVSSAGDPHRAAADFARPYQEHELAGCFGQDQWHGAADSKPWHAH